MVDVMTARVTGGFLTNREAGRNKVELPELVPKEHLPFVSQIAREKHRQEQLKKRELTKQISSKQLLSIKEKEWGVFLASRNRSNCGLSCSACTPDSKASFQSEEDRTAMLKNILTMRDTSKDSGWFAYYFNHIYSLWTSPRHEYPDVYDAVLGSEQVKEAIELSAQQMLSDEGTEYTDQKRLEILIKKNTERAMIILRGMKTLVNTFVLKIVGWLTYKILSRAFTNVAFNPSQTKMLEAAKARGLPMIYLPLHRSHLDYITVGLLLQRMGFRAPVVGAGDNLRVPILEWGLKNCGAFFIKRRIDPVQGRKDVLYRAILYTYMIESLKAGHHIKFFIEGGRTRTGKPVIPKGGLLSIIIDAYMNGTIEDALLIPVSINYDRLVDGNFTREQLGESKQPETLWTTLAGIFATFTSYYGNVRVDFNQPFSLKELVQSFDKKLKSSRKGLHTLPSSNSFYGTAETSEDHRQLVTSVATHVVHDCCQYMPVMSTNAVSFLLLTKFRDGVELEELAGELDQLRQTLDGECRHIGFCGSSSHVILHAVRVLQGLIEQKQSANGTIFLKPVTSLPSVIELSYYSNTLVPHFIMPAVVATALHSLLKDKLSAIANQAENDGEKPTITQSDLLCECLKLCDILQFEFIFTKPCQYLDSVIIEAMEHLASLDILAQQEELQLDEEQWAQRAARRLDEDEEADYDDYPGYSSEGSDKDLDDNPAYFNGYADGKDITYEINLDSASMKHINFYRNIAAPFIESYSVSVQCLKSLVGSQNQEQAHIKSVLGEIKTKLSQGVLKFSECAAVDQIRNSLRLFETWSLLECFTQDKIRLLYLSEEYDSEANLEPMIERITCFR